MKFLNKIDGADKLITDANNRLVTDEQIANWDSKGIKNIGTFNSHEELIMYTIAEQIPTGQYVFFMGGAGHASLVLVRDAGTYYEGIAQGSDGFFVVFDVTKQGQIREYSEFNARDIITSLDDIRSIFSELDDKVDNSRVLTDVPLNAKFTDTITTINGKTGAITKADIVALGIPASDTNTTYAEITTAEIDAGTSSTLRTITARRLKYLLDKIVALFPTKTSELTNDSGFITSSASITGNAATATKLQTARTITLSGDVSGSASFDGSANISISATVADDSHNHVISNIDNLQTALDGKVDNSRVLTDVPANAKFTDTTYSEISEAEIDAGTSSTRRTITGRRVKYILDKVQGWIGGLTKSDVGLSNVDNVKQMPISGGVLENYREKLVTLSGTSTTINLSLGNVFTHTLSGNTAYSITNAVNGQAHSFTLIITQTETVRTITFPASVKWQGGEIPNLSGASKTYVLTFLSIDGGTTWFGMYGGEFGVS